MIIKNNVKAQYLRLYPNLTIKQIQNEIVKFEKEMIEAGQISGMSSNYHKYLRGWLVKANSIQKDSK